MSAQEELDEAFMEVGAQLKSSVKSTTISNIVTLTEAQYAALGTKNPTTLYVTVG